MAKAAAAAAEELAALEATAMALGAIVPPSPTHQPNSPTHQTAAKLQRLDNEQAAARPPATPNMTPPSLNPFPSPAQVPVLTNNANNANNESDNQQSQEPFSLLQSQSTTLSSSTVRV